MARTCKKPGCTYNVFGGGYCRVHQWLRTDKKPKELKKRTLIKSVKTPDFGFQTQLQVFRHIFFKLKKPVICPISGRDITDIMNGSITQWITAFAHILPKGKYPLWRLNPRNVKMINPVAHNLLDQGTELQREEYPDWNWAWWDNEVELARKEYRKFLKENQL